MRRNTVLRLTAAHRQHNPRSGGRSSRTDAGPASLRLFDKLLSPLAIGHNGAVGLEQLLAHVHVGLLGLLRENHPLVLPQDDPLAQVAQLAEEPVQDGNTQQTPVEAAVELGVLSVDTGRSDCRVTLQGRSCPGS